MKLRWFAFVAGVAGLVLVAGLNAQAAPWWRRRSPPPQNQNRRPPPAPANPATNTPAETQKKFKELRVNAEFYFPSDTEKNFLKIKVSETTARTVSKAGQPPQPEGQVPADAFVVPKETAAKTAKAKKKN